MRNDGSMLASVATMLPFTPRSLNPVNMDMLTARSPGAVWERVMSSEKSSSLSQFLRTISFWMSEIMA